MIEDPEGFMLWSADGAAGERGMDRRLKDKGDDRLFRFADGIDGGLSALLDAGKSEGHSPSVFFREMVYSFSYETLTAYRMIRIVDAAV